MLRPVHPQNPQKRVLDQVAKEIGRGAVYIIPTDTVYAFVTGFANKKSIARLYQLKDMPENKPLSLYCRDFSQAAEYIRMDYNQIFRWMKGNLPGPYTLIFPASKNLPNYTLTKQKTVGIRIVDNPVVQGLLERIDMPIIGTSVFSSDGYLTYPEDLEDEYGKLVDGILDIGPLDLSMSTILDATVYPPEVIREGKGELRFVD